jgi:phenylpyruvate tautomerase
LRRRQFREILPDMPLVRIVSNQSTLAQSNAEAMLSEVSRCVANALGKPERWVMTCLDPGAQMTFSGTTEPACYVEVKSIGTISSGVAKQLSAELCALITKHLSVAKARTYIEFAEAAGPHWGYDGSTFG